jgi:hypothetical protein
VKICAFALWRIAVGEKKSRKPFVLGKRGEEIVQAMRFCRYMTALDVCYLMYSPNALTHARAVLADLCGGADFVENQYLYRFRLPDVALGNQKVYTLGSRGRDFLESELGMSSSWYFRPEKVRHLSYGQVMHSLALTRFLVAARRFAGLSSGEFKIGEMRICYDLAVEAGSASVGVGEKVEAVVPDAWMTIEWQRAGRRVTFPVLVEIDRGTMFKQRFKKHVRARIEFVRGGEYERVFGTKAAMIVYAVTGERLEQRETRRRALCEWTKEVLAEARVTTWADMFRFCAFSFGEMYTNMPFGKKVWYRPDRETPVMLLEG